MSLRPSPYRPAVTTPALASEMGFWPLTIPYQLPEERWMLDRTVTDLTRTDIPILLVGEPAAPEVWRNGVKLHDSSNAEAIAICPRTRKWANEFRTPTPQ